MHVLSGDLLHCLCKSVLLRENYRAAKLSRVCVLSVQGYFSLSLYLTFSFCLWFCWLLIEDANVWSQSGYQVAQNVYSIRISIRWWYSFIILGQNWAGFIQNWRLRRVLLVSANRQTFKFSHLHFSLIHHWNVLTDPLPHRQRIKTFECTWCVDLKVG